MTPDKLCGQFLGKAKGNLKISILDQDTVVFEGSKETLEFVGKLFISQAQYESDCGFGMSPVDAGKRLFIKKSKLGFYIHRVGSDRKCDECSRAELPRQAE
jgi:hypothetical protein